MVLVIMGTLAQRDMGLFAVQEKYFSSWVLWLWNFPMPGARPTMLLMFINLSFLFFNKNFWKIKKLGIIILHLGGMLLLIGGGLTALFSTEGNIIIDEGSKSNYVEDYNYMELAIINTTNKGFDTYTIFDHPNLRFDDAIRHISIQFFQPATKSST